MKNHNLLNLLEFSEEVRAAQKAGIPVVALESTIIAHGMPYPQNYETAGRLEELIRDNKCCPATIFIDNGKIRIGADNKQLLHLAKSKAVEKVTTREIGEVIYSKSTGATTVAATMYCASLAGIQVFATGGIGGVHRGAENSFDISADLTELSRTRVIVVSAGAKAILDLGKTLEYLETVSVPVFGWRTNSFPGFYTSATPWEVKRIDDLKKLAGQYLIQGKLNLKSGILLANPVPQEFEIPWEEMDKYIKQALSELERNSLSGKQITPYLLKRIAELTNGRSLQTNIRLVENNVLLACELARELNKIAGDNE